LTLQCNKTDTAMFVNTNKTSKARCLH